MRRGVIASVPLATIFSLLMLWAPVMGASSHDSYISGPLNSGPEVTQACLECHQDAAKHVMQTSHWTWSLNQDINGKNVNLGKKNAFNNFCVAISGNWPRCTSCHIGYGWEDGSFDFSDQSKIDCLVCHDTTGTYKKSAAGAGHPDPVVDLVHVAKNVGQPSRFNCGACHFFGGGGDAVKHGDLDSSMEYPDTTIDVHMAEAGLNFQCQDCHKTENHFIAGNAMVVSPAAQTPISCDSCHGAAPHAESLLNSHGQAVACQTCHIPTFAKEVATKTSWDWSTAGQDLPAAKDEYGKPTYQKTKGHFTWGKNIIPTYAWYNGTGASYLPGDKIDPDKVTLLSYPLGDIKDPKAKIAPFKTHTGKQLYDKKHNSLIATKVFGKEGYWTTFDWDKAARLGMDAAGLPYSGEYGFAPTSMYWSLNHMVAPKEQSLGCLDCHGDSGRLDWVALGYVGDPLRTGKNRRSIK